MAITLTTLARVRQRLQLETWESTDTAITQFIEDAEATITNYLGSLPVSGDSQFDLAGSIATDFAAYYTGISLPTLTDRDAEKARADHCRSFKTTADAELARLLTAPATTPLPKSTTG
jgi:hypothetical protein